MGMYKMILFSAQEGVDMNIYSAQEGVDMNICSAQEGVDMNICSAQEGVGINIYSAQEGVDMNICSTQEGVSINIYSAQEGVDIIIHLMNIAITQANYSLNQILKTLQSYIYKIVEYLLYKYFQILLLYQNACKVWILTSYDLHIIYCCSQMHISVYKKCRIIWLSLMRFICKCHDFKVFWQLILSIHLVTNAFILGYCILLFFTIFDCAFHKCNLILTFNQHSTKHKSRKRKTYYHNAMSNKKTQEVNLSNSCPPKPPYEFAEDILESGCAVCGQLIAINKLSKLSTTNCNLQLLSRKISGITHKERTTDSTPIEDIDEPLLDTTSTNICILCENSLNQGLIPKYALANGLWLDSVPLQLQNLTFAEELLISYKCQISSSRHEINANPAMFKFPPPKYYQVLPPSLKQFKDILTYTSTYFNNNTIKYMKGRSLLVRKQKLINALEWLKLNHIAYYNLSISYENLNEYPNGSPIVFTHHHVKNNNNQIYKGSVEMLSIPFVNNSDINIIKDNNIPLNNVHFNDIEISSSTHDIGGGHRTPAFTYNQLHEHIIPISDAKYNPDFEFKFVTHCPKSVALGLCKDNQDYIFGHFPLSTFLPFLIGKDIKTISNLHNICIPYRAKMTQICETLSNHYCNYCESYVSVFEPHSIKSKKEQNKTCYQNSKANFITKQIQPQDFPPLPPSLQLQETVIQDWCTASLPKNIKESGCAVCGQLIPFKYLLKLSTTNCNLQILSRKGSGITRKERTSDSSPIEELNGPVLDSTCEYVCISCENSLKKGLTPKYALAKGVWLGCVPPQLQNLTFAEKLLIARVRHNKCIVRVSSGMHKMKANAIMFENPTPKIYQALPPSVEELDDVLAFIFTGPCKPTDEDMKRTPLLVRRRKVCSALEWLKLNHVDYYDLDISYKNLKEYPENGSPVVVAYRHAKTNKNPESTSAFDQDYEDGVEDGPCPFVVNGITGEDLEINNPKALIARATKHLMQDNGGVLAISHDETPQSIYHNPKLYPMMFPHLFPYGLGGIGSIDSSVIDMSEIIHKRHLLMYHDK